jgi:DNA ligase-1
MQDHIDMAIVGAIYGRGRRAGRYGALLVAAYDPEDDLFKTVCKVGSGFTDQNLEEMSEKIDKYKVDTKPSNVDSLLVPDIWFDPEIVIEVLGDEITLSPLHTAAYNKLRQDSGLAIRFPRFTRWREDKSVNEITQVTEIENMYKAQLKTI